ncbi:MAG: XRE family transcriptional regulator [Paramuribaculum sp.]|nr:XRE family transcriptional regulator [Paramuribaculum sp.]
MKEDNQEPLESEPIYIGKIIEEELRNQERTVTWLSRKIHCDRRNIYDIFSRTSIDTDLLYKLSLALNKDFFAYFSTNLQLISNQSITPPHIYNSGKHHRAHRA